MPSILSLDLPALARHAGQVNRGLGELLEACRAADALPADDPARGALLETLTGRVASLGEHSAQMVADLAIVDPLLGITANGGEHPATDAPKPLPPPKLESVIMSNPTGMRELILIADHEARVLRQTEAVLTEDDYRVITARDGFEAISLYNRLWTAIDLVILDFALPGMSGDLIFDELLGINPNVAVVVSSGFHQPAKLSAMLSKGLCGFLPKPYDREKLLKQVQAVLAHRRR